MKQKKKNKFFTFIFSLLPGAAEMYMGFMKNGLSMMVMFFISFVPMILFDYMDMPTRIRGEYRDIPRTKYEYEEV